MVTAAKPGPSVVSANCDRIIEDKRSRSNQYKDAISAMNVRSIMVWTPFVL